MYIYEVRQQKQAGEFHKQCMCILVKGQMLRQYEHRSYHEYKV